MSGLIRPSAAGPRELKSATVSRLGPFPVAPTAITEGAEAGEEMELNCGNRFAELKLTPSFPTETAITMPA